MHHVVAVSIPFIAGQWSLLGHGPYQTRPSAPVSIPFIAGQWSLLVNAPGGVNSGLVSIPFIAGQWSLRHPDLAVAAGRGRRFNPLHCGAVVASSERSLTR